MPVFRRFALSLALCALMAACQTTDTARVSEDHDWGIPVTTEYRDADFHAPTPTSVPGATVISTEKLAAALEEETPPLLIDVLGGDGHNTIPGAVWLKGAGWEGTSDARLDAKLAELTNGDKFRDTVFFCLGPRCWLSYNAAMRASRLGYVNTYWYRGGVNGWEASGRQLVPATRAEW
ncbi:rhodanese-like domain-containing protein [Roseospirillum parvum]|uniref:PQQ-dependent catabolism-associated CXXCW motif protein n=1 Tax=Roseospirillum parvum TaxID=83401 RepID=A0A1G7UGF9_9PROT|nr:rhodanese-like domain-containing protein [Roseospirillum parvum]SDG46567.1 PQQ-dependent catabolism-associated CXXCW motif protein [Roseospirillum parvum]